MKICFLSSKYTKSLILAKQMINKYGQYSPDEADLFVCLGGDGFMLHAIHNYHMYNKFLYGINCGSIGFLLNKHNDEHLFNNINNAKPFILNALITKFTNSFGYKSEHVAFNEVSFMRSSPMAAHLQVCVNNEVIIDKLVADGLLVATPTGSSAYNLACGGTRIAFSSNNLVLTGINSYNPLRWKSKILQKNDKIEILNISPRQYRKVNMFYDFKQKNHLLHCTIQLSETKYAKLLLIKELDIL